MLRIRFHGRGGQGIKTASRIVGSAAFRQGYYAQDSPLYGAERRGAPIVAFTRFDSRPIVERGLVASPDLVVIADDSLLSDPMIRPLQGLDSSGFVLINSRRSPEELRREYSIDARVAADDLTALALSHAGSISALSVAVGAATAKLAGLEDRVIEMAVREELHGLALNPRHLEDNLKLAAVFRDGGRIQAADFSASRNTASTAAARIVKATYDGPWMGTASVATAPNTPLRKTGDWRVMRPAIDFDRCTHCWICFVTCPDGAITLTENSVPVIDYGVCKGCLMCVEECPVNAIGSLREMEAR